MFVLNFNILLIVTQTQMQRRVCIYITRGTILDGQGNIFSLFTPAGYLPWPGEVPTVDRGVPTLDGGYLPWIGDTYLGQAGMGGTYLGLGVPTLAGGGVTHDGGPLAGMAYPQGGRRTFLFHKCHTRGWEGGPRANWLYPPPEKVTLPPGGLTLPSYG